MMSLLEILELLRVVNIASRMHVFTFQRQAMIDLDGLIVELEKKQCRWDPSPLGTIFDITCCYL